MVGYHLKMSQPFDKFNDPFAPPAIVCRVQCIHCGSVYDSSRIRWRDMPGEAIEGAWCCPIAGCDGIGFKFDIHPIDDGWDDDDETDDESFSLDHTIDEEDDEDDFDFDDEDAEEGWLPASAFDEDAEKKLPIDEFAENAFWLSPNLFLPRPMGNTEQPPYKNVPYFKKWSSIKDDDIPF